MQTSRMKLWDALRCRCSSLSQQHMAQKFAKVCSYKLARTLDIPCSVSACGRGTAVMRRARAPSDRACRMCAQFSPTPPHGFHSLHKLGKNKHLDCSWAFKSFFLKHALFAGFSCSNNLLRSWATTPFFPHEPKSHSGLYGRGQEVFAIRRKW